MIVLALFIEDEGEATEVLVMAEDDISTQIFEVPSFIYS
jgi:hypothetical protein